jgi:hypothetical protein
MTALIATTVLTLSGIGVGQGHVPAGLSIGELAKPRPKFNLGYARKAPSLAQTAISAQLNVDSGLPRLTQWQTLFTLGPEKIRNGNSYLIYFRPACVDAGGLADMMGLPGGWHSEPGDDQSYLLTYVSATAGKRYGLVFEIWRYEENSGPAQYEFESAGGKKTRNLTGSGFLHYSFVAPETGRHGVFLRMASKGRYLFRKVEVRQAVS